MSDSMFATTPILSVKVFREIFYPNLHNFHYDLRYLSIFFYVSIAFIALDKHAHCKRNNWALLFPPAWR